MPNEVAYEYDGYVYVRPVSRGVHLLQESYDAYLEDVLPDGYYRLKVSLERLSPEEEQAAPWRYPWSDPRHARDWPYTLIQYHGGFRTRMYDWQLEHRPLVTS